MHILSFSPAFKRIQQLFLILGTVSLFVLIPGCGSANVPLTGHVTFESDGRPLSCGVVCFESGTSFARGEIQGDGSYSLGSKENDDGLPKAEYKVYIIGAVEIASLDENGMPVEKPLINAKFMSADTSGLTCSVDGKNNTFDIVVSGPGK
ncbi:MAG: hypothetical protein Q4G68_10105 [Planctomycetia bacterium]|nr:hypothetical protein [Planctomycetia bacterium]